ncbi:MAG TPA: hypothetical protein VN793_04580 [Acidimicrobiales bacterium]|nr:hypothetical protein [Acidimicrobiales bacterium]
MPPSDLDERLRRALALPREPAASEEAMGSVVSALPGHRARRRALVGATGASVLGVLGLTLGLLVVGLQGKSPTTSGQFAASAPSGPTCVQVQVGTRPASCVGRVTSTEAAGRSASPGGQNAQEFAPLQSTPSKSTATIQATTGERIVVSMPRISGVSWDHVTLHNLALSGPSGSGEGSLKTHVESATGRTVAVVPHAMRGGFALVATGSVSCTSGPACVPTTDQWSITLNVR